MSAAHLHKIFDAFSQADSPTTRRYGGTGLGLSLSKQLAQKMGGDITVMSRLGQGSCFTVTIATGPLAHVDFVTEGAPMPQLDPEKTGQPMPALSGCVLLAEDNLDNQRLITMYIRKSGATSVVCADGQEAVERALSSEFDLVLMDMQMPVMDGLEATSTLRQRGFQGPIVALTANVMREDVERCLAAGCDDFLTKPIDRERFVGVLATYLNRSSPGRIGGGLSRSTG